MKRKSLLTFGLIAIVSTHTFAMEIVKGKIVQHKEWTTGSVKAVFQDINIDRNQLARMMQHKNGFSLNYINATTRVDLGQGPLIIFDGSQINPAGQESKLVAYSTLEIDNLGERTREYTISSMVCTDTTPWFGKQLKDDPTPLPGNSCAVSLTTFSLDSGGSVVFNQRPTIQFTYPKAGMYYVNSSISVAQNDQPDSTTYSTVDSGYINVPAAAKS